MTVPCSLVIIVAIFYVLVVWSLFGNFVRDVGHMTGGSLFPRNCFSNKVDMYFSRDSLPKLSLLVPREILQ